MLSDHHEALILYAAAKCGLECRTMGFRKWMMHLCGFDPYSVARIKPDGFFINHPEFCAGLGKMAKPDDKDIVLIEVGRMTKNKWSILGWLAELLYEECGWELSVVHVDKDSMSVTQVPRGELELYAMCHSLASDRVSWKKRKSREHYEANLLPSMSSCSKCGELWSKTKDRRSDCPSCGELLPIATSGCVQMH